MPTAIKSLLTRREEDEKKKKKEKKEKEKQPLIKSNNPHLAGGESKNITETISNAGMCTYTTCRGPHTCHGMIHFRQVFSTDPTPVYAYVFDI